MKLLEENKSINLHDVVIGNPSSKTTQRKVHGTYLQSQYSGGKRERSLKPEASLSCIVRTVLNLQKRNINKFNDAKFKTFF